MTNGSRNERWLAAKITGPSAGMCSRPIRLSRKYRWKNGCSTAAHEPVDERVDALGPRAQEELRPVHAARTTARRARLHRARGRSRTRRRAREYGARHGDRPRAHRARRPRRRRRRRRLGRRSSRSTSASSASTTTTPSCSARRVTRGRAWPAVGLALHLLNGAPFGALYANVAPRLPLPSWARGPAAGAGRARRDLAGDRRSPTACTRRATTCRSSRPTRRAFAQATWRHLLFGVVLGELERRLNADDRRRGALLRARRLDERPRRPRAGRGRSRGRRLGPARRAPPAGVAQLVEQRPCKAKVRGSSPLSGSSPRPGASPSACRSSRRAPCPPSTGSSRCRAPRRSPARGSARAPAGRRRWGAASPGSHPGRG